MQKYDEALEFTTLTKNNFKGALMTNAKLSYEVICLMHATCLKMCNKLDEASKTYIGLEAHFKRNQARDLVGLLWGLILIPLSEERKVQADHVLYLKEYLDHVYAVSIPPMDKQNLLLSKYCIGADKRIDYKSEMLTYRNYKEPAPRLNFETFPKSIWKLIS